MRCDAHHTLIVGGGVIGIACAHYLKDFGFRVTVIDKGRIGGACSQRNCGLICPSHVLPLANPGAIGAALKAMLRPGGVFRIRPRLDLSLWTWLGNFALRCNRRAMRESGRAIQPLLSSSFTLYRKLVEEEGLDCEWQERGLLLVYQSDEQFRAYDSVNELLSSEFNEAARRFEAEDLQRFEPALKDGLAGGWYFENDAHLRPERLLTSWRSLLEQRGVRFVENCELLELVDTDGVVNAARVSGDRIEADSLVVATGAWTPKLARILRCRVPIEPGKGYSVIVPRTTSCPRVPMIFPEHRVAVTPFQTGMRIGSIMEFAGWDSRIRASRLSLLTDGVAPYLRAPMPDQVSEKWYGWRPMTYDSTPVIGPCPSFSNVFLATGHNMLGLSMAPATGRLVSELIRGVEPHVEPEPYSADRF